MLLEVLLDDGLELGEVAVRGWLLQCLIRHWVGLQRALICPKLLMLRWARLGLGRHVHCGPHKLGLLRHKLLLGVERRVVHGPWGEQGAPSVQMGIDCHVLLRLRESNSLLRNAESSGKSLSGKNRGT